MPAVHVSHETKSQNSTLLTVCSSWHSKGTYCPQLQHKAVFEAKALETTHPVTQRRILEGTCFLLHMTNIPDICLETWWLQLGSTKFCSFLCHYGILAGGKSLHKETMDTLNDMAATARNEVCHQSTSLIQRSSHAVILKTVHPSKAQWWLKSLLNVMVSDPAN